MITKEQGIAYAALTLDLLQKLKIKVTTETFIEQMQLIYDLYETEEVVEICNIMVQNNKIITKNTSGKANCYVVNIYNSAKEQMEVVRRFCGSNIEIGKIYISTTGENSDKYYDLIKDIRNKEMDILFLNVFTILGMSEIERSVIVHLCRKNEVILIEI